ncbi:MAG: HupE/UreJ family protein [Pseudorhodobacter sp.]|nr:HupE/UreJ family protein [Pseudorhodobacter sp.]
MSNSFMSSPRVCFHWLLSSLLVLWITFASAARAHEVLPAIADMTTEGDRLTFSVRLSVEGLIAGIDLGTVTDTNEAPQAASYDALRALPPEELQTRFTAFWPEMARNIRVLSANDPLPLSLDLMTADPTGDPEFPRLSTLSFSAALPAGTQAVQVGWSSEYGALVLRQMGVEAPFDGYIEAGALSDPITLAGGDQATGLETFLAYIPVGFDHIVPKGLDHILFVLGLFFLSTRLAPLLWQVSAFTLAHTVTLAAGALGYVTIPGSIVEPIIAASIVYVAVENILTDGLNRWRPFVIFGFGLLHGLGFASVLGEFGLPENAFVPALIGFNIGVELGQLAVIAVAFALVGYSFGAKPWYRKAIAIPASAVIAAIGAWWVVERVFL